MRRSEALNIAYSAGAAAFQVAKQFERRKKKTGIQAAGAPSAAANGWWHIGQEAKVDRNKLLSELFDLASLRGYHAEVLYRTTAQAFNIEPRWATCSTATRRAFRIFTMVAAGLGPDVEPDEEPEKPKKKLLSKAGRGIAKRDPDDDLRGRIKRRPSGKRAVAKATA